jgi:hypothetical protein
MFGRLICYHALISAVIPDELLDFHPADCELNGLILHWKNLKPGRAPGIENGSGVCGNVPDIHRIFPSILGPVSLP